MTEPLRTSLRTSDPESPKPEYAQIGARLLHIRAHRSQREMAEHLGVSPRTYTYWEYGQREVSAHALGALAARGWNANWILTGEGPEKLEPLQGNASRISDSGEGYASHDVSEDHLIIALELAEGAIRGTGTTERPPLLLYGRLLRLIYQGVSQGLPVAEVRSIAGEAAQAFIGSGGSHDSKQGVDRTGPRRAGGDRGK